jgi:hypothetical protein
MSFLKQSQGAIALFETKSGCDIDVRRGRGKSPADFKCGFLIQSQYPNTVHFIKYRLQFQNNDGQQGCEVNALTHGIGFETLD